MTIKHFAHYILREIRTDIDFSNPADPWFAENQPDNQGFDRPFYHVTQSASGPSTRVEEDDYIWLFSQLASPWDKKLPPALDAKIVVKSIDDRKQGFRFEAGPDSRWFPLADASSLIAELQTKDITGNVRSLLASENQHIGRALQSMREIENSDAVLKWESDMDALPNDFVSYRLIDGTKLAFEKVCDLLPEGRRVFWDRWSLPRRLAERREFLSDDALDAHIFAQMPRCDVVWGISSEKYAEKGSYSLRERDQAQTLGKLKMYP